MEDIHVRIWHSDDGSHRLEAFIIPPISGTRTKEHWAWVLLLIEEQSNGSSSSKRVAWGHGGSRNDAIDCVTETVKRFGNDGELYAVAVPNIDDGNWRTRWR